MNGRLMGKGSFPSFCVCCMLICQWTSLYFKGSTLASLCELEIFILYFWWFLFKKSMQVAFGECAIQKRLINVIFELVPSLTFWGLPILKPFFLWLCFLTFSYLSEEERNCQIRGWGSAFEARLFASCSKSHFSPSLSPPKANTLFGAVFEADWIALASMAHHSRRMCRNVFNPLISCSWRVLSRVSWWESEASGMASLEFSRSPSFLSVAQLLFMAYTHLNQDGYHFSPSPPFALCSAYLSSWVEHEK